MKFYFKLNQNGIIEDAITYAHEGYTEVTLSDDRLPAGINAGYYKWDGTDFTIDTALKSEIDKQSVGEFGLMEERLNQVEQDNANLLMETMNDKLRISDLELELGNAVFEIMNLKANATTGGA